MSELIIHIGVPKTGTTAVQGYLYQNRARLAELGIYYPETFLDGFPLQDQWAHHLHAHKWGGWLDRQKFQTSPDAAWQALRDEISAKPGRYIISSERFADLFPTPRGRDVLDFISNLFSDVQIRFIAYVRRQDVLAESFLKQAVKVNIQQKTLEQYLSDLPPFLDYDLMFSTLADYVGWENVIVRLYERSKLVEQDAAKDFLHTLGIEDFNSESEEILIANESINTLTTSVLLELAKTGALNDAVNVRRLLREYLEGAEFDALKKLSLFDPETCASILAKYETGNRALVDKLPDPEAIVHLLKPVDSFSNSLTPEQPVLSIRQFCRLIDQVHKIAVIGALSKK